MLSLSPASRRRFASGTAAVGTLVGAGLGLTASGSGAAAVRAGVQQAVGVPPAPAAPGAPAAPEAPAAPQAPAATAPAKTDPTTTGPATTGKVKNVVVIRNGRSTVYDAADVDAHLAAGDRVAIRPLGPHSSRMIFKMDNDPNTRIEVQAIPAISSANCGIGAGKPTTMVIDSGKGEKRKIVICTDRIQKVTADAMATAANSRDIERDAYGSALAGLLDARTKAAADAGMSDADRARALSAIDTSIVEIRSQLARFN